MLCLSRISTLLVAALIVLAGTPPVFASGIDAVVPVDSPCHAMAEIWREKAGIIASDAFAVQTVRDGGSYRFTVVQKELALPDIPAKTVPYVKTMRRGWLIAVKFDSGPGSLSSATPDYRIQALVEVKKGAKLSCMPVYEETDYEPVVVPYGAMSVVLTQ